MTDENPPKFKQEKSQGQSESSEIAAPEVQISAALSGLTGELCTLRNQLKTDNQAEQRERRRYSVVSIVLSAVTLAVLCRTLGIYKRQAKIMATQATIMEGQKTITEKTLPVMEAEASAAVTVANTGRDSLELAANANKLALEALAADLTIAATPSDPFNGGGAPLILSNSGRSSAQVHVSVASIAIPSVGPGPNNDPYYDPFKHMAEAMGGEVQMIKREAEENKQEIGRIRRNIAEGRLPQAEGERTIAILEKANRTLERELPSKTRPVAVFEIAAGEKQALNGFLRVNLRGPRQTVFVFGEYWWKDVPTGKHTPKRFCFRYEQDVTDGGPLSCLFESPPTESSAAKDKNKAD
jgi:hypothetical protein